VTQKGVFGCSIFPPASSPPEAQPGRFAQPSFLKLHFSVTQAKNGLWVKMVEKLKKSPKMNISKLAKTK
jgi:hypothetical protein